MLDFPSNEVIFMLLLFYVFLPKILVGKDNDSANGDSANGDSVNGDCVNGATNGVNGVNGVNGSGSGFDSTLFCFGTELNNLYWLDGGVEV